MTECETLQAWVNESRSIVFFGGAGISTESGIPDFRSPNGLFQRKYPYPAEVMLSHDFYRQHTREFFAFYREAMIFSDAKPNAAHLALSAWEQAGKLSAVITQNIDGLHQAAGSQKVYELHGSVHRNYCEKCGKSYPLTAVLEAETVPYCECGGIIKPDVVLYQESLRSDTIEGAIRALEQADLLIVGGTSLRVYPAAGLLQYYHGKRLVVINREPTDADRKASLVIHGSIGTVLQRISLLE